MRHGNYKYRIGTNSAHRKALLKNLAIDLIDHGKIKSTHTKCKALQPFVEKLITIAKDDTVANRRLAFSKINNKEAVAKLFNDVAPKYKERNGGYTRVLKYSETRLGDGAEQSFILFV